MSHDYAVVAYANHFQFGPGDQLRNPAIHSRMFLWCRSGLGTVRVNGEAHALAAEDFLFLPWRADVVYAADRYDPFMVGGVHVVPDHAPDHPVVFEVAHTEEHPLARAGWRRDVSLAGLAGVLRGRLSWNDPLLHLAEYTANSFIRAVPSEWQARALGALFLAELERTAASGSSPQVPLPAEMQQVLLYIHDHLHGNLSLPGLAAFTGKSVSSVGRMFRRHLGCTANHWVQRCRVEQACRLLRTTRMPIAAVGEAVGLEDAFYFSKLFKKWVGIAPLAYRKRNSRL